MRNWRKVNDEWINFDFIEMIYVNCEGNCQYKIYVETTSGGFDGSLFNKSFLTEEEAQVFLDDFMSQE